MITASGLKARLAELDDVGIGEDGVNRLAWTEEDERCRGWFGRQAQSVGRSVARDPAGNLWACPEQRPPWWAIGSHLDSVRAGGRFDGPLGVVCGFEIAARSEQPFAVISFADEEGARFNTPTFGSKALAGRLDLPFVLERRDPDGISLAEAMRAAGVEPDGLAAAPEWLGKLAGFIEIHIDQSTDVARAEHPVGVVSGLASRVRLEVDLRGRADHAGATQTSERRDALSAAAHLIITAEELGEAAPGLRVTASRIFVEPNAPTTIAARVRLWIDARAREMGDIDRWREALEQSGRELASRSGVEIGMKVASRSPGRAFSSRLHADLLDASEAVIGRRAPEVLCFAGHDAGVLAERLPAAMVLVRNPAGVSHSPAEQISLEDAAVGARVVQRALAEIRDRRA